MLQIGNIKLKNCRNGIFSYHNEFKLIVNIVYRRYGWIE